MGHSVLGQELSFGDALKAQPSPESHHHSGGGRVMMLSDLIGEHGPLAASAMSSPTHTTTFILPAQQTSPAQLAGLVTTDNSQDPVSLPPQLLHDSASQQAAWAATDAAAVAAGIAAGDLMTFQVDGQIKLGLRPRQLTFSASAQQPPQLGPQLWGGNQALPATLAAPPQATADGPLNAGPSELSPVPLLASPAASDAGNVSTDLAAPDATIPQGALSEPDRAHQGEQTTAAGNPQQQDSLMAAEPPTQQASVAVTEAMGEAAEPQTGQQLTTVAPSLSWPAAPSTGGLSRQQSARMPPPPARQPSAVAREPSAVPAAAVPSRQNSSTLSRQNSQQQPLPVSSQAPRSHQSASREGSTVQLSLSRQASEAAGHSARAEELGAGPEGGSGRGLEQAWAALLPSLLAEASKQHSGGDVAVPPSALLPAMLQQQGSTDAKQPAVGDILKLWAPVARPAAAGIICRVMGTAHGLRNHSIINPCVKC